MSFHCEGVPIDDIGIRPCDREQFLEEMQELSELHIVKIKDGVLSFDDMVMNGKKMDFGANGG